MSHASNPVLERSLRALLYRRHAALALLAPGLALAGPTGEDVVGGDADIIRPDARNTIINQYTDRAAINWQTFNIDADEYVTFNQPGASSIVLNRVLGGDASYLLGHMQSNGQVFLLNPHGVYFTHGASLDVQGFLGSTLDMDPNDFMAGDFSLTRNSEASLTGNVINDGTLTTGPGGYIVLAGDYTENTGIIAANAGSIALVSGNALTLDIQGDGLVNFAVNEATLNEAAGVRNAGSLIADGGRVIMTAKVANDLVATAVNNEGLVRARSVEERGGEIYLVGYGGDVVNAGTLDADGENADGGSILAYSDRDMTLADGAVQTAAGDDHHEGGFMRFVAEEHLDYQQDNIVRATGSVSGGFVEVSGHGGISLRGIPQIGPGGQLLIDPQWMAIRNDADATPVYYDDAASYNPINLLGALPSYVGTTDSLTAVNTGWISNQLQSGVDVTLVAEQGMFVDTVSTPMGIFDGSGGGNLAIGIGYANWSGASTIGAIDGGGSDGTQYFGGVFNGPFMPTITWLPGGQINLGALNVDILGDLDVRADAGTIALGEINANNINITTGTGTGLVDIGGGSLGSISASGNITVTGASIATSYISNAVGVTLNGNVTGTNFYAGSSASPTNVRNLTVNGNVNVSGAIWLNVGSGSINLNGSVAAGNNASFHASGGDINISGGIETAGQVSITANGGQAGGGNILAGDIRAARIDLSASSSNPGGMIETGNLVADSQYGSSGGGDIYLYANGGIKTGSITVINRERGATLDIYNSSGDILVNGNITASGANGASWGNDTAFNIYNAGSGITNISGNVTATGYGGTSDGYVNEAVDFSIYANNNINIGGSVTITGHAAGYSVDNGSETASGTQGRVYAEIYAQNGDLVVDGPISVTGTGDVNVDLYGRNVTTGNIAVLANPSSYAGFSNSSNENIAAGGSAELHVASGFANGTGAIVLGNVSVTGPDASLHMDGAQTYTTGAITVNATGNEGEFSYSSSYGGYAETGSIKGGWAELIVGASSYGGGSASSTAIDINGAINVSAVGNAMVALHGDSIATRGISVTATAGEYSRDFEGSGGLRGSNSDWPFNGDFGGPKIDEGTVVGGQALLFIGGVPGGQAICEIECPPLSLTPAAAVSVAGDVTVKAPGQAEIAIFGGDIEVTGNIDATAAHVRRDGTYTDVYGSGNSVSYATGEVESSMGVARVQLHSLTDEAVNVGGSIRISGPQAGFDAIGGSVTLGNLSVTGTGFELEVHEVLSDGSGNPVDSFDYLGSHFVTGVGVEATGAASVGDVAIEGIGAAGIIFAGATITTGDIKVRATAGEFTTNAPSFTGGDLVNTPTGAAVIGFESPVVATVNGDIIIEGARTAHVGGRANASGDFTITAGRDVFGAIPGYVDFLDHVDDGDIGEDPLTLPAAQINAANITASVTNGNLSLADAVLATNGAMTLQASGAISMAGRSQTAGSFDITAGTGLNISNASLNADGSVSIEAGTTLNATGAQIGGAGMELLAGDNLRLDGAAINADGALALAAGTSLNISNATLDADGSVSIETGTTLNATSARIGGTNIGLLAGGNLRLDSAVVNADAALVLAAGDNMTVSNVSLDGATVEMSAGGDITNSNPPGTITAGALAVTAGGIVDLSNTALVVGDGRFADIAGDSRFLQLLALEGVATPGGGPNLYMEGESISLGNMSLAGDYAFLSTNNLAVNGTVNASASDLLLQVAPLGAGATFSLERSSPSGGDASYLYTGLEAFDAATIALGTTNHTGTAGISANSTTLDIGDTNLFVLTQGEVRGLDRVVSTGIVKDLATLLSGGFDIPQTHEIDARQDRVQSLRDQFATHGGGVDEEEEGDEEGEDTDTDTDVEDDDDSLIRRDTVDEEMMCR